MASVSDFTGAAGKAFTGDPIGAGIDLLKGFISGPSNWHKADDAWQAQQWPTVAQAWIKFYNEPSFNSNNQSGFNGDLQGFFSGDIAKEFKGYNVRRYERLGQLYLKTNDQQILQLYNKAVAQGLIEPNPAIGPNNPTPAFVNAISGAAVGSVSGATAVNMGAGQQAASIYNNAGYTPAASNAAANNANNKPAAPASNTTMYIIIAAVAAVVVVLIIVFLK